MDSNNAESLHAMISNDSLFTALNKEELAQSLKSTKLNLNESNYILQKIQSEYEILDRLNILRHLSIDFGDKEKLDSKDFLGFLKLIGKSIDCDIFDSIVEIIDSLYLKINQSPKINSNIEMLKILQQTQSKSDENFKLIYYIFERIADANDGDAISFAIKEGFHKCQNRDRHDIFHMSCKNLNFKLAHLFIEASEDCIHRISLLPESIYTANLRIFHKLPYYNNNENLFLALREGNHKVVNLLLTFPGLDVNAKDYRNRTALIYASQNGHHEVVKLLLTVPGLDVNAKDSDNMTALIRASKYGYHEVVKLLLTVPGLDVNAKDSDNMTALIRASWNGHHEVVKLLLTVPGIDVNAKDKYNNTALIWSSKYGYHEVVKLLLTVPGIDVNAKDKENWTALNWAKTVEIKLMLKDHGAI